MGSKSSVTMASLPGQDDDGDRLRCINDVLRKQSADTASPWLPLESNPEIFSAFARSVGMPAHWGWHDVLGLDVQLLVNNEHSVPHFDTWLSHVSRLVFTSLFQILRTMERKNQSMPCALCVLMWHLCHVDHTYTQVCSVCLCVCCVGVSSGHGPTALCCCHPALPLLSAHLRGATPRGSRAARTTAATASWSNAAALCNVLLEATRRVRQRLWHYRVHSRPLQQWLGLHAQNKHRKRHWRRG